MKKDTNNKEKDNNNPLKQFNFKFNFYWIYGIIFALLIGYQMFNSTEMSSNKLSENEFKQILNDNDVDKIVIVNKDIANLHIKSDALGKEKYKKNQGQSIFNPNSAICWRPGIRIRNF